MDTGRTTRFTLGGMTFEYDEEKNRINIRKHGISFRSAARVFFDYDRIEFYDVENSIHEDRYDTIGKISVGFPRLSAGKETDPAGQSQENTRDIIFVVYTERQHTENDGIPLDVTRLISARMATNFERGLYYGKCE